MREQEIWNWIPDWPWLGKGRQNSIYFSACDLPRLYLLVATTFLFATLGQGFAYAFRRAFCRRVRLGAYELASVFALAGTPL